jgi:hypothetical protein
MLRVCLAVLRFESCAGKTSEGQSRVDLFDSMLLNSC